MGRKQALLLFGALSGVLLLVPTGEARAPRNTAYSFVLTDLSPAFNKGKDSEDCPEGLALTFREAFLAAQAPDDRARLQGPENAPEFEKRQRDFVYDGQGRQICAEPQFFNRPPERTFQGRTAFGMDLDGDTGSGDPPVGVCTHANFEGVSGEQGVDNQYFRAVGCNNYWRGPEGAPHGDMINSIRRKRTLPPENTVLILLNGVDDWRNDDEVGFQLVYSPDPPALDTASRIVEGASYNLTQKMTWRNSARASIQNGVLTTEPMNIKLHIKWVNDPGELELRRARFRLEMTPTGELTGLAGAYWPVENVFNYQRDAGPGFATSAGIECASHYKTLTLLADGDRDPETGRCSSISTAFSVAATPAFAFDGGKLVARAWTPPRVLTR